MNGEGGSGGGAELSIGHWPGARQPTAGRGFKRERAGDENDGGVRQKAPSRAFR